jgi:hypothetical protein
MRYRIIINLPILIFGALWLFTLSDNGGENFSMIKTIASIFFAFMTIVYAVFTQLCIIVMSVFRKERFNIYPLIVLSFIYLIIYII